MSFSSENDPSAETVDMRIVGMRHRRVDSLAALSFTSFVEGKDRCSWALAREECYMHFSSPSHKCSYKKMVTVMPELDFIQRDYDFTFECVTAGVC